MALTHSIAEQRREPRQSISIAATLRHYRDSMEVQLLDLSSGGAMAATEHPPGRGEEVLLIRGALQIVATVAWVRDRNFGLCFHRPVERRALLAAA